MIVGAGLAGLISAHAFQREPVVEIQPEPSAIHKALLRFRTKDVGELTGIEFKPVTVHKGIYEDGIFHAPNIRHANLYATKVLGRLMDRSIWSLDSVVRYIAPPDFYEQLVNNVSDRIVWGSDWYEIASFSDPHGQVPNEPVISTAPMSAMLDTFNIDIEENFAKASIHVQRFEVDNCDLYQTVYFPTLKHSLYRASITGNVMICEFAGLPGGDWNLDVHGAFGTDPGQLDPLGTADQKFGKIAPIDEEKRRAAIVHLTEAHNIFSVGRFATWRNILLDDVVKDIAMVKQLINDSAYGRRLKAVGGSRG